MRHSLLGAISTLNLLAANGVIPGVGTATSTFDIAIPNVTVTAAHGTWTTEGFRRHGSDAPGLHL